MFISMILSIIFATFIVTMFFGNLQVVEDATMDSLTYYDAETFYQNLELQGETGRASYLYLHVFDYFFMVSFALFLITVIALLVKRIDKIQRVGAMKPLVLLPIISFGADLLENICIDVSLMVFPKKLGLLGEISGYASFIKMNVIIAVLIVIGLLLLWNMILVVKNRGIDKLD